MLSKIGQLPIALPDNTTLTVGDGLAVAKGPLGELSWGLPKNMMLKEEAGLVTVVNTNPEDPATKAMHGLTRARLANMVKGVSAGFERILDINGVGFRAEVKDTEIWLHIGFSHIVKLVIIPGVSIKVTKNEVVVSGIDKESVGEMAARLRASKKPEPYKGKGIKYREEIIRRKQGKAAKGSTS